MKKLALFFIILVSLVILAGCNRSEYEKVKAGKVKDSIETTIKKVKEGESKKISPFTMKIPTNDLLASNNTENKESITINKPDERFIKTDNNYYVISGTTISKTQSISVNGIKIKNYKAGNKNWKYIVSTSLSNLKKGRNKYKIQSLNEKGEVLSEIEQIIDYSGNKEGKLVSVGSPLIINLFIAIFVAGVTTKKA